MWLGSKPPQTVYRSSLPMGIPMPHAARSPGGRIRVRARVRARAEVRARARASAKVRVRASASARVRVRLRVTVTARVRGWVRGRVTQPEDA